MKVTIVDDGFMTFVVTDVAGKEVEHEVDAVYLYNRLAESVSAEMSLTEINEIRRQLLQDEFKVEKLSTAATIRIGDALVEYFDTVKKKESSNASAATPSNSASPSGPSTAAATLPA